ncbi:MAG TPA: hypothetical protein VFB66_11390 [Tepidisphaeraceae bacterium]|nr:hypothetical protein [Tepidisphaeraceae bacterium]
MPKSYRAILCGDRVTWTGDAPQQPGPIDVEVTIRDPALAEAEGANGRAEAGRSMAAALGSLASSGAFSEVRDPVAWQRDARRDRPLPGRSDGPTSADAP